MGGLLRWEALAISGGTFTGTAGPTYAPAGLAAVITLVNSSGSITGGSFVGQGTQFFVGTAAVIVAMDDSRMAVSGGHFVGDLDLFAGTGSVIDFYGSGLQFTYYNLLGYGHLSGTLADGSAVSADVMGYVRDFTGERAIAGGIEFYATQAAPTPVPEPSSVLLVGLGTVLVAPIAGRRRRR